MDRYEILEKCKEIGVVPVVRTDTEETVFMAVEALLAGGIPVIEITMTIPNAIEIIHKISDRFGESVTVGAGSVTDLETCERAIHAGSQFVVTPAVNLDIVSTCSRGSAAVICGGLSPTEILTAWEAGADAVKVFPIKAVGGPEYIYMIREPLPQIPLVPTGGVSLETIGKYLQAGVAFVGAGGDLVNREALQSRQVEYITKRARQYVAAIRKARQEPNH